MKFKKLVKKEKKKINKKQAFLIAIGVMFVGIMVLSSINLDSDEEGAVEYNGIKFHAANEGWLGYLKDGRQVFLLHSPSELANMSVPDVNIDTLNAVQKIYVSYNPEERVRAAMVEFYREIKLQPMLVPACTTDVPQCADMPLKTCEDANEAVGVIIFRQANETNVQLKDNCLIIEGQQLDSVVDKLILEQIQ